MVINRTARVDGLSVFYREAGTPGAPKLLLLGRFPASSHQFRSLIPALAERFHVVSPDYPGFGNTDMPDPAGFPYTFDRTWTSTSWSARTRSASSSTCSTTTGRSLAGVPARAPARDADPLGSERHLLHPGDTGHFAVEDKVGEIAEAILRFHAERVAPARRMSSPAA